MTAGRIFNRENLTLSRCVVSGNRATTDGGGIANDLGGVMVVGSTISGNFAGRDGGGIHTRSSFTNPYGSGRLEVTDSTISGNTADSGGGIFSDTNLNPVGTTTISNSTISGNLADGREGGGLFNFSGAAVIRRSTITNNTGPSGREAAWLRGAVPSIERKSFPASSPATLARMWTMSCSPGTRSNPTASI